MGGGGGVGGAVGGNHGNREGVKEGPLHIQRKCYYGRRTISGHCTDALSFLAIIEYKEFDECREEGPRGASVRVMMPSYIMGIKRADSLTCQALCGRSCTANRSHSLPNKTCIHVST